MTTFVRRLALWKAQKGAYIGQLEQLQASISLPSTIKTVWSLRAFSFTSIALVSVWSFYYLGSQACKEEFRYQDSARFRKMWAAVQNSNAPSLFQNHTDVVSSSTLSDLNLQYLVAVESYEQANALKGFDLNGDLIVPFFALSDDGRVDRHGWTDVSKIDGNNYASLVGETIYANQLYGNEWGEAQSSVLGGYEYTTSYIVANCSLPSSVDASAFPKGLMPNLTTSINVTNDDAFREATDYTTPRKVELWDRSNGTVHSTCNLTTSNFELKAYCTANGCAARKMRPAPAPYFGYRTPFDDYSMAQSFFANLLLSQPQPSNVSDSTVTQDYIALNTWISDDGIDDPDESYDLSFMSLGFTQLINTYLALSQQPYLINSNSEPDIVNIVIGNHTDPHFTRFSMKGAVYDPRYALSIPWIIVDLMSCQILLAAAVAAYWLRKKTLAPDIFGYVSSLTRDNPHLDHIPDGGTTLSGLERARMLKNIKVKIADVGTENGVGRVGLSHAGASVTIPMSSLQRGKYYE